MNSTDIENNGIVHVHFDHGLGDCANFARMLRLYIDRGYSVKVSTPVNKEFLFRAVGAQIVNENGLHHPWLYPDVGTIWEPGKDWAGNKTGCNLCRYPLPDLGNRDILWKEMCEPRSIEDQISRESQARIDTVTKDLPTPIILVHLTGNTNQAHKSIPENLHHDFYRELLNRTDGTIIVLDWDNRNHVFSNYRLRRHVDLLPGMTTEDLCCLMTRSDLIIGIDSGPFHLAGLTNTPRAGLFRDSFYPSTYCVPTRILDSVCLVSSHLRNWNIRKRIPFSIVETDWTVPDMVRKCLGILDVNNFTPQLNQFMEWCQGSNPAGLSSYCDRNIGFRKIFKTAYLGNWIETGTIRSEEDWSGAGYSTYLFGAFLNSVQSGKLFSVDMSPENCRFARRMTNEFGDHVCVENMTGEGFIDSFTGRIDLLYCDSCDTTDPQHAAVCLGEVKAALGKMQPHGIIAFDDSPFSRGNWTGKGTLAIPFLLDRGWKIVYAGYQAILRNPLFYQSNSTI